MLRGLIHAVMVAWIACSANGLAFPRSSEPYSPAASSAAPAVVGRRAVLLGPGLLAASQAVAVAAGGPQAALAKGVDLSVVATDRSGAEVVAAAWVAAHAASRKPDLVLGPGGEPHYLLMQATGSGSPGSDGGGGGPQLAAFALKAECTHLGCLVALDLEGAAAGVGGFACPCHGSRYSADGRVLRGPAPRALALVAVTVRPDDGKVVMTPWAEPDFRLASA